MNYVNDILDNILEKKLSDFDVAEKVKLDLKEIMLMNTLASNELDKTGSDDHFAYKTNELITDFVSNNMSNISNNEDFFRVVDDFIVEGKKEKLIKLLTLKN